MERVRTTDACFDLAAPVQEQIAFLAKLLDIVGPSSEFSLKKIMGGCTNSVFRFRAPTATYAVRVFGSGTEVIIDRRAEMENIVRIGFVQLCGTFGNGMVLSWQKGKVMDSNDMADPIKSEQIAKLMGEMHRQTLPLWREGKGCPVQIFGKMEKFLSSVETDPVRGVDRAELERKMQDLRDQLDLEMEGEPIVLCHGDWHSLNLLWDENEKVVRLLDYEYCEWIWAHFDIANHFFEWGGINMNPSKFPSFEEQLRFLRTYLESLFEQVPTEDLVLTWQRKVEKLVKLSNLFWAFWGFFSATETSDVEWPYELYANLRLRLMEKTLPLQDGDELKIGPLLPI
jgi:ethanolamine kinase